MSSANAGSIWKIGAAVGSATGALMMGATYARTGGYDLGIGVAALAGGIAALFFASLPHYRHGQPVIDGGTLAAAH